MVGADKTRVLTYASKSVIIRFVGSFHVKATDVDIVALLHKQLTKNNIDIPRDIYVGYLHYAVMVHHRNSHNYHALMSGNVGAWK